MSSKQILIVIALCIAIAIVWMTGIPSLLLKKDKPEPIKDVPAAVPEKVILPAPPVEPLMPPAPPQEVEDPAPAPEAEGEILEGSGMDDGKEVDVIRLPNNIVRGQVIDADTGLPIEEFQIRSSNFDSNRWLSFSSETGEFECGQIAWPVVSIEVRAEGYLPTHPAFPDDGTLDDIVIYMTPGQEVAGVVLDAETGEPVQGALVRLHRDFTLRPEDMRGTTWGKRPAKTDREGRFGLGDATEGDYILVVKTGYAPTLAVRGFLREGEEYVLTLGRGGHVAGTVKAGEVTLPDSLVALVRETTSDTFGYQIFAVTTDAGGFEVNDLPPGLYNVAAYATVPEQPNVPPDWVGQVDIIEYEVADLPIVIEMDGRLVGQTSGFPEGAIMVMEIYAAEDEETLFMQLLSDGQGTFEPTTLPAGEYILRAYVQGESPRGNERRIDIAPGVTTSINVIPLAGGNESLSDDAANE